MADGSGEDEKVPGAHAADPTDPRADPAEPPRPTNRPSPSGTVAEWTVSDRRGPLNAASEPHDDVERFVPGSETDAEGTHDASFDHEPTAAPAATFAPHTPPPTGSSSAATSIEPEQSPGRVDAQPARSERAGTGASQPPSALPAAPRRSALPLAIAVVIGAAIGAGSAALVYSELSARARPAGQDADGGRLAAMSTRLDAIEKRPDPAPVLAKTNGRVDDLAAKMASLQSRTGPSAEPTVPAKVAATPPDGPADAAPPQSAADGMVALNAKIAALQSSVDALQKQAGSSDVAGKIESLQASLAGVQSLASNARTNVDALKSQQQAMDGKLGDLHSAVGDAQKQALAAKSGVDVLQSEQKSLAGKLGAPALAVVADSLVAQVASGKPYATQVDALASLGADPVKVALLRQNASSGVPSSQALLAKFKPLVDPIVATGSKAPANANFGQRLVHGLYGLVSVHRTDVTTGNDLSSKVALIQADLANDDVAGAFGVWDALPADAKRISEAWGASAKTSVEAVSAARGLQAQSIGSLAAKKS